jgi:5-methylcytosine-specific restriction protein A
MSTKITKEQYAAAFAVAVDFYQGRTTLTDGSKYLRETRSLNMASARDYMYDFKCMMNGQVFHRAMSADAIDYFFSEIELQFGLDSLRNAVNATNLHITYYEALDRGKLNKLRGVVEKYQHRLAEVTYYSDLDKAFQQQVLDSLNAKPETRRQRLQNASPKPKQLQVTSTVFIRNPDVVAETLIRANGICEGCKQPAPFLKKSDGLPYLEVHHKTRLADDGDDTVANTIALCPNCHRKFHYGV